MKIREIEIDNFYFKEKIADLSFDRKPGEKTLKIREIENFYFTEKITLLLFDRKTGKTWQFREIENDNFHFTEKSIVL